MLGRACSSRAPRSAHAASGRTRRRDPPGLARTLWPPYVRHPDAFLFGVHLDPVGGDWVSIHDDVLQDVAWRVVDGILDLAYFDARGIFQLVALHWCIRILVFHGT